MAAIGFLRLLIELRPIFLQDAVLLCQQMPNHFIFQQPLFDSPAFHAFERNLLQLIAVEQMPAEQRLQAAMPQLVDLVASGFASTIQAVSTSHLAINDVKTELGAVAMVMADVISS